MRHQIILTVVLLAAGGGAASAETVNITIVTTGGDQHNHATQLVAVRSDSWDGLRRAYCIEPGEPLSSGAYDAEIKEIKDKDALGVLALAEALPTDLAHAVALEAVADDDMDLRTGETRFAVPDDWGGIQSAKRDEPAWILELQAHQDLVVFGSEWDGESYQEPIKQFSAGDVPTGTYVADQSIELTNYYRISGDPIDESESTHSHKPKHDKHPPAVPLPAAVWLFVSGLVGLSLTASRRMDRRSHTSNPRNLQNQ